MSVYECVYNMYIYIYLGIRVCHSLYVALFAKCNCLTRNLHTLGQFGESSEWKLI